MKPLALTCLALTASAATITPNITASAGPTTGTGTLAYTTDYGVGATATATYGSLSADAHAGCGSASECDVSAYASFTDGLAITDASGILHIRLGLGLGAYFGDGGRADAGFTFGTLHGSLMGYQYFGDGCLSCVLQIPFAADEEIPISGWLSAYAVDTQPRDPYAGADEDALYLAPTFSVTDAQGNPLVGFHYGSESGHDYGIV